MSICRSCGAETQRLRVISIGKSFKDECPQCQPQSFEGMKDPSAKKIWIGPEFAPNDYIRTEDGYQLKPEAQQELEEKACGLKSVAAREERETQERLIAEKRKTRRTRPMTEAEIREATAWIDTNLRPMIEDTETAYEV